jgi:hypothetical protein
MTGTTTDVTQGYDSAGNPLQTPEEIASQIDRAEDKIEEIQQTPEEERDAKWEKQFQAVTELLAGLEKKLDHVTTIATTLELNQTKPEPQPEEKPEPVLEIESEPEPEPQRAKRQGRNPKTLRLKRAQPAKRQSKS